jgi:hypothetical protein
MKKIKLSVCIIVLASFLGALIPGAFAQHDNPTPIDPHHVTSVDQ